MQSTDEERPESIAMGNNEQRIYMLTETGILVIFSTETLAIVYQRPFHRIGKEIIPFRRSEKIMLIFEQDVICIDSDPKRADYQTLPQYSTEFNKIFCVKLTFDEKKLAVGTITSSKPQIQIFTVDDRLQFYKNLRPSSDTIKFIDFSVDNDYMMTEDIKGNVNFFEMHTDRNIDEKAIDF